MPIGVLSRCSAAAGGVTLPRRMTPEKEINVYMQNEAETRVPNPFGLAKGSTPPGQEATYIISFRSVPKPHPDFASYSGSWHPKKGLTSVFAVSAPHENDAAGLRSRRMYDRLRNQLSAVYGPSAAMEEIEPDSVWDGDREFCQSLLMEERTHFSIWDSSTQSKLDAGIVRIMLSIEAEADDISLVRLSYMFDDPETEDATSLFGRDSL